VVYAGAEGFSWDPVMREMGHLVRESQMVACRGGRGLVGVGAPGSRRLDKRRGVKRGESQIGKERWR
jgi:hypothetical protein